MTFHIITIFPEAIKNYFDSSILGRAQKRGLIKIKLYNPRDFTKDKHKKVDDIPFGGGPGMAMKIEPIANAVKLILNAKIKSSKLKKNLKSKIQTTKIVLFSPVGKQFKQEIAKKWAEEKGDVILICGRYEGIDERLEKVIRDIFSAHQILNTKYQILKLSVGPYILSGGELPAGIIVDAIARHIPRVIGSQDSLEDDRGVGIPVYTRPEIFEYNNKEYKTPKVLLSGNHKQIQEWRGERKESS